MKLPVTADTFVQRLRRNGLLRAMGHNPNAPNCMFAHPWEHEAGHYRGSCAKCAAFWRKYPYL